MAVPVFRACRLAVMALLLLQQDARTVAAQTYDFAEPDTIWVLPGRLSEISGLTVLSDSLLGAVQDEEGDLHILSMRTGLLLERKRFRKDADYEAIALGPAGLFVAESDGDLHRLYPWPPASLLDLPDLESDRTENWLRTRNDVEGLAYDHVTGSYWMACKEDPGPGNDGFRSIFAYDPDTDSVSSDPVLRIDLVALDAMRPEEHVLNRIGRRLLMQSRFKPSGIAFLDSETLLVVTSIEPAVLRIHRDGTLLSLDPLPLPQPEGIAVGTDGTVYIASEGSPGRLAVFRPRPK